MILLLTHSFSLQQQDVPEPTHSDGSPFEFFPPAPVVLFCKNSPPLKKVIMQKQPITPQSASKKQGISAPVAPRVPTRTRTTTRNVAARKTLRRRSPSPESSHVGWPIFSVNSPYSSLWKTRSYLTSFLSFAGFH